MEVTLSILISICALGMTIINFFTGRTDKASKDSGNNQYKQGVLETKIDFISKQVQELSDKLDKFDNETDIKINNAIKNHIAEYHK